MLRPGLHIKRWLLLLLMGVTIAGLGLAFLIRQWYVTDQLPPAVYTLALRSLPDWLRGMLLLGLGLLTTIIAVWYLNRSIIATMMPGQIPPGNIEMVNVLLDRQRRRQGPRIVAIGGGTGMPQLLRGLRAYTDNLTAIVTVADDGGSSGRLRRHMGMLPPGDFRNNIAALSEAEDLMTRLFQYRFAESDVSDGAEDGTLAGHSFGNLFITTMAAVTGSFESGIAESSRVLAVRGQVLPSTLEHVTLCAEISRPLPARVPANEERLTGAAGLSGAKLVVEELATPELATPEVDGEEWLVIEGESKIPKAGGRIMRVFLKPEQTRAYPVTLQAILQADLIVAAPGSFFTSVMPNLLVPAIRDALSATAARAFMFATSQHNRAKPMAIPSANTCANCAPTSAKPLPPCSPTITSPFLSKPPPPLWAIGSHCQLPMNTSSIAFLRAT